MKTVFDSLGREPVELEIDTIHCLRLKKEIGKLHQILGHQLFVKWLYISGFMTVEEYQQIAPLYWGKNENLGGLAGIPKAEEKET